MQTSEKYIRLIAQPLPMLLLIILEKKKSTGIHATHFCTHPKTQPLNLIVQHRHGFHRPRLIGDKAGRAGEAVSRAARGMCSAYGIHMRERAKELFLSSISTDASRKLITIILYASRCCTRSARSVPLDRLPASPTIVAAVAVVCIQSQRSAIGHPRRRDREGGLGGWAVCRRSTRGGQSRLFNFASCPFFCFASTFLLIARSAAQCATQTRCACGRCARERGKEEETKVARTGLDWTGSVEAGGCAQPGWNIYG